MVQKVFGDEVTMAGFSLRGCLPLDRAHDLMRKVVEAIGMSVSHAPVTHYYPAKEGEESPGYILHQCIIESFVAFDVWPPRNGLYVHAVSCRDFDADVLAKLFRDEGFKVRSIMGGYLSL